MGKIVNKTDFLNSNDIEIYSRYTSKGTVFDERFNRTIHDLLDQLFNKWNTNCVVKLPKKAWK